MLNLDDEQQSAGGSAANEDAVDAAHAAAQSWSRAKASQPQLDKLSSDRLSATASTASGRPQKVQPGRKEDLLIVMPSNVDRMPIVAASRGWRQGVKTYVTFEQEIDLANSSSLFQVYYAAQQLLHSLRKLMSTLTLCQYQIKESEASMNLPTSYHTQRHKVNAHYKLQHVFSQTVRASLFALRLDSTK